MAENKNINLEEEKIEQNENVTTSESAEVVDESVKRDESLDLKSLMTNTKPVEEADENKVEDTPEKMDVKSESISPLDAAIRSKQTGIEMATDEIEVDDEQKVFKNTFESEERQKDVEEKNNELTELAEKAKLVVVIRKPTNPGEDALMMGEIEQVYVDEFGKTIIPEDAKFIKAKVSEEEKKQKELKKVDSGEDNSSEVDEDTVNEIEEEVSLEDVAHYEERKKVINIIMDKTGLGREVLFTQDEQKEITEANEIHITEVENLELETLNVDYDDNGDDFDIGFMHDIESYQLSISKTPMVFPCSGFKAEMLGMTWGELADVTLDYSENSTDMLNFDKVYKKCTVIYNKMKNISCGAFTDFTDFLKKFAFMDLPLATYGLLISTQPETDTIGLVCQKDSCRTRFNQKYATRSLIDFDTAVDKYLEMIKKIAEAATSQDYVKIAETSDVRTVKRMRLPNSGFIVEIGPISMYDYLYKVLKVLKVYEKKQKEAEEAGNTFESEEANLSFLLQVVRAINIPKKNGKHTRVTNGIKILRILSEYVAAADMEILSAIYTSCQGQYNIEFSVKKAICPNCGTVTEKVSVEPDELVFYARQRLVTTNITVDNFPSR